MALAVAKNEIFASYIFFAVTRVIDYSPLNGFRPLTVSIAYYYGKQIIFRDKRLLLPCRGAAKRQRAATISPSWIGSWWQTKWIDKATSRRYSLLLGRTTFGQNHHIYLNSNIFLKNWVSWLLSKIGPNLCMFSSLIQNMLQCDQTKIQDTSRHKFCK